MRMKKIGGKEGKKPLGERIIWLLPSSGAVANRRGWVPTIPVTLEVSWRKATLINLSPRLRRMIASSNAQNNPPSPKAISTAASSPSSPLHIQIYLPPYLCAVLLCPLSITLFVVLLPILFISHHRPPPSSSYALKSLWISSYKQWINPSPPCVNGPLNTSLCL